MEENHKRNYKDNLITNTQFSPFSFGFGGEVNTCKMKPLDRTLENETQDMCKDQLYTDDVQITEELNTYIWVITSNHLSI